MTRKIIEYARLLVNRTVVVAGGLAFTLLFFLILPFLQQISNRPLNDLQIRDIELASLEPPPPPPVEEEPEEEPEPEETPPELEDEAPPPLSLDMLNLMIEQGASGGWGAADFSIPIGRTQQKDAVSDIIDAASLDQRPRAVYQPSPNLTDELRKRGGTVYIIFMVDENGRVRDPRVQKSTHPSLERPALAAIRQWKFEPGQRKGEPVSFRMRVPITFPKGK